MIRTIITILFLSALTYGQTNLIKVPASECGGSDGAARLVGMPGTRVAGDTITGAYEASRSAFTFNVTTSGPYKLEYDENGATGGLSYSANTSWSGTYGRWLMGRTDAGNLFQILTTADTDNDGKIEGSGLEINSVDSTKIVNGSISNADLAYSIVGLANFTTAAYNFVGSGGSVTNNPDDKTTENTGASNIGIRETVYLSSEYYSTLASAVSAAGANDRTLLVTTALETANHDTIPANITLDFRSGGALSNASGTDTVYIFGHVQAPPRQIFPADVKVYWAPIDGNTNAQRGYGLTDKFYAEWWGAAGDSSTNSTTALQEAINASISRGVPLQLLDGYYLINSTLTINSWAEIYGNGEQKTYIKLMGSANCDIMQMTAGGSAFMRDVTLNGNKANQTGAWRGFLFRDVTSMLTKLERVRVEQTSSWCVEIDTCALIAFEGGNYTQSDSGSFYIHGTPHVALRDLHVENHAKGAFANVKYVNNLSTAGGIIEGCHFEAQDSTWYSLYIDGDGLTVIGNDLNHNKGARAAIYLTAASQRNTFINNNVTNADTNAIVYGSYNKFFSHRSGQPGRALTFDVALMGDQNLYWYEGQVYGVTDWSIVNADTIRGSNFLIRRQSGNTVLESTVGRLDVEAQTSIKFNPGNNSVFMFSDSLEFTIVADTICAVRKRGATRDTTRIAPPRP